MKRSYVELWSIPAVAFAVFFCLSLSDGMSIAGWHVKGSALSGVFTDTLCHTETRPIVLPQLIGDFGDDEGLPGQICLSDSAMRVLIIGDSMLEGLGPRLMAYCDATGHKLYSVVWYSSSTYQYGSTRLISDYIKALRPQYIFISLGGNELFVSDVAERREKYVREILSEIGDIPYLWIGPPNWKPDTGINDLLAQVVPPGCLFMSRGMHFDRQKDGAHPTYASAALWVDSIMRWMPDHAHYYLPLDTPRVDAMRPTKVFIHQPGDLTSRPI